MLVAQLRSFGFIDASLILVFFHCGHYLATWLATVFKREGDNRFEDPLYSLLVKSEPSSITNFASKSAKQAHFLP